MCKFVPCLMTWIMPQMFGNFGSMLRTCSMKLGVALVGALCFVCSDVVCWFGPGSRIRTRIALSELQTIKMKSIIMNCNCLHSPRANASANSSNFEIRQPNLPVLATSRQVHHKKWRPHVVR